MKKILFLGVSGILLLIGLSGCTTTHEVNTQYSHLTAFSGLKTYAWLPEASKISGEAILDDSIINEAIHDAVESELKDKNFVKYPQGEPDFLIQYHVVVEDVTEPAARGRFYDDTLAWKGDLTPKGLGIEEYRKGTLILDIIDAKTKTLLWRGSTAAEIYPYAIRTQKVRQIKKGVKAILAQFPPRQ